MAFNKIWSESELELLKTIKSTTDIISIAKTINRSEDSVKIKSKRIGVFVYPKIKIYHTVIPLHIKAYLAGHFDGEGCIGMYQKYDGNLRQRLTVQVTGNSYETLELYKKYFNGTIRESKTGTNKQLYKWTCGTNVDIYNFIESILQFSIEKKSQIIISKNWIENRQKEAKNSKLSDCFIEYSNNVSDELKYLKK